MMDDEALNARIDEILWRQHPEIQRRNSAEYDGVMGQLPGWMPENFHREFHSIRDRLLATNLHADLLAYVAELQEMGMRGNRDAGEFTELVELNAALRERELGISPGGMFSGIFRPRTPAPIWRDVSILAQFHEAVRLGPDAGLALLTDRDNAERVAHGRKFPGRKPDSIGPVRKFIRAALKKKPETKNEALWQAINARPPSGWTPMESVRLGRYIEGPSAGDEVKWKSFCSYAALERKRLKNP